METYSHWQNHPRLSSRQTACFIDTGLNLVDARDTAIGHLLAAEHGRTGERYILGSENLTLQQILERLALIANKPAPATKVPYALAFAAGVITTAWGNITGRAPIAPLEGVRMARKKMFVTHAKAGQIWAFHPRQLRLHSGAQSIGSAPTATASHTEQPMAILYVASLAMELEPFAALLTGIRKLKWPIDYAFEGVWEGRRVMLAANGAGPQLAAQAVEIAIRAVTGAELSSSKLEAVVSTGFCGALDPDLREGQIVIATEVLDLDANATFECGPVDAETPFASGVLISQDRIANYAAEKQQLRDRGALAIDMEAGGVCSPCKASWITFLLD